MCIRDRLCIVIIAVILDRFTKAWANKPVDYFENLTLFERHRSLVIFGAAILVFSIIAFIANGYFDKINYLYIIPIEKGLTIAHYIDSGVDWVWDTFFYTLNTFNKFLLTQVLGPMKKAYLGMPVIYFYFSYGRCLYSWRIKNWFNSRGHVALHSFI